MRKFFLYGVNGVINTVVTYGLYVLLAQFIDYRIAVIVTYALGIGLSYVLNGAIVFGMYGRFWLFVLVSLFLMMINLSITWLLVEGFRWAIIGGPRPDDLVFVSAAASVVILAIALLYFRRVERSFADVI